jgi:hypothetical protein
LVISSALMICARSGMRQEVAAPVTNSVTIGFGMIPPARVSGSPYGAGELASQMKSPS